METQESLRGSPPSSAECNQTNRLTDSIRKLVLSSCLTVEFYTTKLTLIKHKNFIFQSTNRCSSFTSVNANEDEMLDLRKKLNSFKISLKNLVCLNFKLTVKFGIWLFTTHDSCITFAFPSLKTVEMFTFLKYCLFKACNRIIFLF